jgi:Xaa-Pro aminopeptidase
MPDNDRNAHRAPPFDTALLDRLMEEADLDALVVTSKHNIRYMMGGYSFFFFGFMDAIGVSRYLPILVYRRNHPDQTAYIGNRMENYERELGRLWTPTLYLKHWGSLDSVGDAIAHLRKIGSCRKIGYESAFIPSDAAEALREGLGNAKFADASEVLERLRAVKNGSELALLKSASEKVVDSMLAVISAHGTGSTKAQIVDALRLAEQSRGLDFEYCLITAGKSFNRSASDQVIEDGDPVSIDSGGNFRGYIGDLCRMAVAGEPDNELQDLLGEIEDVQQAARKPIKAGALGREIFDAGEERLSRMPNRASTVFTAHGMGLISHEAPRLTSTGPVPYPGVDADRPLRSGYVISIETTMQHPRRGFIKLEDTVCVTDEGWEAFGDHGRGWNRFGQ